ncbi:hypothetical protein QLH51_08305 [Sphingomonas sp. 2R-10]|nr:hypothetical protein [Sphingomonas sp. 2R-10]MDJ0276795.1 hypothetical protein [Sphingomonas sp. 2R-10]
MRVVRCSFGPGVRKAHFRAVTPYGGIYICASLLWLWSVEGIRPDRWDVGGAALCLIGTCVILLGPRSA